MGLHQRAGSVELPLPFGVASLAWANLVPTLHRLRRGEGMILAVNLSIVLVARPDGPTLVAQGMISAAVLGLLYFLNDVHDCHGDLNDPGKDSRFVTYCVAHRARLFRVILIEELAVCAFAWLLLGPRSGLATVAVLLVNHAYSAGVKRMVVIDVPFVALWGALYAMVPGADVPFMLIALVGVMTAICHVYQITRDRDVDQANRINTSAAVSRRLPEIQILLCCAALAVILQQQLGVVVALTAALPFLLRHTMLSNGVAWMASKAYFGVVWLLMLVSVHAV